MSLSDYALVPATASSLADSSQYNSNLQDIEIALGTALGYGILSGGVGTAGTGLAVNITAIGALLGIVVSKGAVTNLPVVAMATNRVWLVIDPDDADRCVWEVYQDATVPVRGTKVMHAVTDGSAVTSVVAVPADRNDIGIMTLCDFWTARGAQLPSLTSTQRDAVVSPTAGLVIFNSTTGVLNYYDGAAWQAVPTTAGTPVLTAAAESSNARQVTVQAKNALGASLNARREVRLWIGDSSLGAPTGTAPDGGTAVDVGVQLNEVATDVHYVLLSDANGQVKVTLTESSAKTFYVMALVEGIPGVVTVAFA